MPKRTFRRSEAESEPGASIERPIFSEPVAVYYRQSTAAQVGNISTAIQTIDMVDELERRGWSKSDIILIDDDEGVSGTKRIDEREGMSRLFELIAEQKIGAVACQDEDRLFRDMTQIQVNIFVDTCRKSHVKVITPYFTYDFAHPLHGEFHARQFRFKCEMAAEYIKSYIQGRLTPAKQRLMREGKWAGARMPVGYMVDMREYLPDGKQNPNWRKFVPFEPFAHVVREYYRIFLECGGAIRKTMRRIRDERLFFPEDHRPPAGFKVSYQLKWRGDGYYFQRSNFVSMLINPVYVGHWCYHGAVHVWNNHEPIIDTDTFMRAFNALSQYTLTGEENSSYRPAYQYARPDLDAERAEERPLLPGLIFSRLDDDREYRVGIIYEKKNHCYLYSMSKIVIDGTETIWVRRASWIDQAVTTRFKRKLQATFDSDEWIRAIEDTEKISERERKQIKLQLTALDGEMQNLVNSLKTLTHPYLIQEVETRYAEMERQRLRLETDLARLDTGRKQQISIDEALVIFKRATDEWDNLSQDDRRTILALFVDRIDAYDYSRAGNMRLRVHWKDGTSEEIQVWHKSHSAHWTPENAECLLSLLDTGASQLELAAAFPDLMWYQIFNEVKKHRGIVRFTPSWLGNKETYGDYVASGGRKGKASGSYWQEQELVTLRSMVERQATQLEIMQEFPFRRWKQLKCRIRELCGAGASVPLSGIPGILTYIDYEQQQKTVNSDPNSETASLNYELLI